MNEHVLKELRQYGMAVLPDVIPAGDIASLKAKVAQYREDHYAEDGPFDGDRRLKSALLWSEEVARAVTHPEALWLAREYMETDDVHFCHQPVVTILKPAKALLGTFPPGGWHSDYPYHPGVFPDAWPEQPLGLQFNICVDDFRPETAGTQYIPGSHREGRWPPAELNERGTRPGEGVFRDVRQVEAPAGSAVVYDARTWHRACYELNVSGRDRIAILNAMAPAWVRPMMDKAWLTEQFEASPVAALLDERQRREIDRLCHRSTLPTPPGMPQLNDRLMARPSD